MEIVRGTQEHLDAITRLCAFVHQIHVDNEPGVFRPYDRDAIREFFQTQLDSPGSAFFIALCDGAAAGYALACEQEIKAHAFSLPRNLLSFDHLAVDPAFRRRGVGSALVEKIIAFARENGCSDLQLSVWAFNEDAQRLFRKYGFAPVMHRMRKPIARS